MEHQESPKTTTTPQPAITYNQASERFGPGTFTARERYEELNSRYHLHRARTKLIATGQYDPAKHGTRETEPLTTCEHLELLAVAEYLTRCYKPSFEIDNALRAGATWLQIADALGTDETSARANYRAWAEGQHQLFTDLGMFGLDDTSFAEALKRLEGHRIAAR
jgi:hypothetical protein